MSTHDFSQLNSFLISVSKELFPDHDPNGETALDYFLQCDVYGEAYDRRPELFDKLLWINDEDGMPLWVRPGVDWIPDHELDDDEEEEDDED